MKAISKHVQHVLSVQELLLLGLILEAANKTKKHICFAHNTYFANYLMTSVRSIQRWLHSLELKKIIYIKSLNNKRIIRRRYGF